MLFNSNIKISALFLAGMLCFSNTAFAVTNDPVIPDTTPNKAIHYDIYDSNGNLILSNSTDTTVLQNTFIAKVQATMDEVESQNLNFHHIGVYESETGSHGFSTKSISGSVKIHVKDKSAPVVLSLTAYEPVDWEITYDIGVEIKKVITSGYYNQTVNGIDENSIIIGTYEGGNNDYLYTYETHWQAQDKLKAFYGRLPHSIQGTYSGSHFTVVASEPPVESAEIDPTTVRDSKSTGKIRMMGSTTNNGMTCTYGGYGASTTSISDKGHTTGKYYFEMKLNLDQNSKPDTWTWTGIIGSEDNCNIAYQLIDTWGSGLFYPDELKDGDIIGIAIDLNNSVGYASLNNEWSTGEPNSNDGFYLRPGLSYHAAASCSASSSNNKGEEDSWTAAFKKKNLTYDIPSSYSAFEY